MLLIAGYATQGIAQEREESRPVVQEYRVEVGGGTALSTYLSPLRYDGTVIGVSGQWTKASQWAPESLVMQFNAALNMRDYLNPARTASMIGFDGMFAWGMQWRKRLPYSLQVTAGGSADIDAGCLYLTRNGNNPVSVLASASLDINASLSWRFKIGRLPSDASSLRNMARHIMRYGLATTRGWHIAAGGETDSASTTCFRSNSISDARQWRWDTGMTTAPHGQTN